ncbi:FDLD family class I lanthipeptide [Streptomyces griseoloalbus]|uniref:FDLD family class I lanthipeptide n=1 Tax=Streptomyces griseoloalbus TaxID=67303 RepID=A0ABV3EGS5_9ACTN
MSDVFDLDARVSTPTSPNGQDTPMSISGIATRTICTRVTCQVTKTCACTSMCTILCSPEK